MTHRAYDGMLTEAENWLAKKTNITKSTFRDIGKWTDRQAKYILSNVDELAHKYKIEPKLSDTVGDIVQSIKHAISGTKTSS